MGPLRPGVLGPPVIFSLGMNLTTTHGFIPGGTAKSLFMQYAFTMMAHMLTVVLVQRQ